MDVNREDYQRGFLDALALARHYLLKYKDPTKVLEKLEELRDAVEAFRMDVIKKQLMLLD